MENWNGYYTKDDPDDRLKPWDNPIVKEAIDTAKEEKDETLKIIAKAKAEIMEWISQQTEEERQEEEATEKEWVWRTHHEHKTKHFQIKGYDVPRLTYC